MNNVCKYCKKSVNLSRMKWEYELATSGTQLPDNLFFCVHCGSCYKVE